MSTEMDKYIKLLTMVHEANKKICSLETKLKKANEIVENVTSKMKKKTLSLCIETKNRKEQERELAYLRDELDETKQKLINNEQLFEKQMIQIYSDKSAFTCDQLENFDGQIRKLSEELNKSTAALESSGKKIQVYENELNEEKIKSKEKDRDIKNLMRQYHCCIKKLNDISSQLETTNTQNRFLESELKSSKELSVRINELEEELINVKNCLRTKVEEIQCKNRELDEINRDNDRIRQELKDEIISEGKKIEELRSIYDKNLKNLAEKNDILKIENNILSQSVEKSNNVMIVACNKEQYWRKNAKTSAEKLKVSIDEIKNSNREVKCVYEKLSNIEKILKNTKLKLTEENYQKELYKELYCSMANRGDQLDKLNSSVVQNEIQMNEYKTELLKLSNEHQKLTDINNGLCKRLEDLEISKSRDRQLNETVQNLNYAEQNTRIRENEMNLIAQITMKFLSREKILKLRIKNLKKQIRNNNECLGSLKGHESERFNDLIPQSDDISKDNKTEVPVRSCIGPNDFQRDDSAKTRQKSVPSRECRKEIESKKLSSVRYSPTSDDHPLTTKIYTFRPLESGAETKSSLTVCGVKRSIRTTPGLANRRTSSELKRCSSMTNYNINVRGPPAKFAEPAKVEGGGDEFCNCRNTVIIAKLKQQLDQKIQMRCR